MKIVPFLNQLGEISIGGQSINLAPGLGNAMAKSLDQSITLGKELAEYTAEQFTSKNNKMISNKHTAFPLLVCDRAKEGFCWFFLTSMSLLKSYQWMCLRDGSKGCLREHGLGL